MDNRGFSLIEILVVTALLAFLAVYIGAGTSEIASDYPFYQTCYRMEEIKEAIIGRTGLYCNGIPQFTGYVSDMGNLPDLYYTDDDGEVQRVTQSSSGKTQTLDEGGDQTLLAEALRQGFVPQPEALWKNRDSLLPEWQYFESSRLWAGWRGPYLELASDNSLRDAWGNKFIFVLGDVIGHEGKTYRCKKDYTAYRNAQHRPGDSGEDEYWEVIYDSEMSFRAWQDLGTAKDQDGNEIDWDEEQNKASHSDQTMENAKTKQETFYGESCLTIISLGGDGKPGGDGVDKDIVIVIEPAEFTGEVAGNAGDRGTGNQFAQEVCLYFPDFTDENQDVRGLCINEIEDNSIIVSSLSKSGEEYYTGIDFRFGRSDATECTSWECESSDGNCTCIEYGAGECLGAYCEKTSVPVDSLPDGCIGGCFMNLGIYPACWVGFTASCDRLPGSDEMEDGWDCECTGGYGQGSCEKYECDNAVGGGECTCEDADTAENPANTLAEQDIPIGIRTLSAGSVNYTIPVSPGGNWVGTVRSGN